MSEEQVKEQVEDVAEQGTPEIIYQQPFITLRKVGEAQWHATTNVPNWELDILRVAQEIRKSLGL